MIPTVNVTVAVHGQDGTPVRDALVFARLTTVERYNGYVVAGEYEGRTDEKGRAVVAVFPNELGSEGSEYRFRVVTPEGKTFSVYASVPNADCNLHQICELEPAERRGAGQVVTSEIAEHVTQSETARDMAREAANRAQASAAQVDASAQTSTAAASQALGYSNAAKRASEEATALVQRAEATVESFESEVISRVETEAQRLGDEASAAVLAEKSRSLAAIDAHTGQKTEELDSHSTELEAALTASLGARKDEAISAVRIERDAALILLQEEGAQLKEDLETLAERSEDAAKRAACSAATAVKAAFDIDEALADTALELLAPQVVTEAVQKATEIALDSANTATVEAAKSRQSAETACACADEAAANAQAAANSADSAGTSAAAADGSASAAAASETVATAKAGESAASATAAKASENAAKTSERFSAEAANTATTKAGEASASADAAGVSETNAASSATAAAGSANVASAAQTAAEAACEETKKVAVLPATTTARGSVKPDGLTISVTEDGTITAKDVAVGGNQGDLASARGIFDTLTKGSVDCNTLTEQGVYAVSLAGTVNGPGFSAKLVVFNGKGSAFTNQMAIASGVSSSLSVRVAYRAKNSENVWSPWSEGVLSGRIGDGITVNNGIISVPQMQGATSTQAGVSGLVPPPLAADAGKVLGADGTWSFPKDVAIGGNLADLASARGQIGNPAKEVLVTDFNDFTTSGVYWVKWNLNTAANRPPFQGSNGLLFVWFFPEGLEGKPVVRQTIYRHGTAGVNDFQILTRSITSNVDKWGDWLWVLTSKNAGDGIKMVNDKFSVPEYEGATASTAGTSGLVPPATAGQQDSFLTGGGEYKAALTKISDSVALADSTTAGSAMAVKTAYDKGVAALNTANTKEGAVHRATAAPSDTSKLWINTADGTLNYFNGSAWVSIVGRYADA